MRSQTVAAGVGLCASLLLCLTASADLTEHRSIRYEDYRVWIGQGEYDWIDVCCLYHPETLELLQYDYSPIEHLEIVSNTDEEGVTVYLTKKHTIWSLTGIPNEPETWTLRCDNWNLQPHRTFPQGTISDGR